MWAFENPAYDLASSNAFPIRWLSDSHKQSAKHSLCTMRRKATSIWIYWYWQNNLAIFVLKMEEHFVYFLLNCFPKLLNSHSTSLSWHTGVWFKQKHQHSSPSVMFFSQRLISQKEWKQWKYTYSQRKLLSWPFLCSPSGKSSVAWKHPSTVTGLGCSEAQNGLPGANLAWPYAESDTCLPLTSCNYLVLIAASAYCPWVPWKVTQSSSA